ncbi:Adaptor protein complex 1 (AP-1); gamma subunit [Paratrimastix pyriformis]|uniref:AP-1 complex subunit gamma n=1 Tax=Paratrimastix pyriformis TaxID=342808 RepID=A0ABQ8UI29_9EUKA|nr:Adaptor protein complex 1 (AP-1); gamma subunit [Paratrimastix pyriformis]
MAFNKLRNNVSQVNRGTAIGVCADLFMSHLKDFIREIRACKTAAEEREVVARESADIRTSFKDMKCKTRDRNMAKLLFIHLLGYPAYFGQVETVNLIASSKFHEKRLGYLALMVLLDEQQDLLMLLPNTMKTDMASPSNFMTALALVALGNIGNSEMIRDLSSELEKCFRHSHAYIRKKATLCAVRAIRKDPDVADQYAPKSPQYDQLVPTAVRALKSLLLSNYSSQHDVAGITDPFLQIKLLQVMRVLGRGNKAASDLMNDVLAQVATNTDHRKNAGTAVLYECVQTVLSIEAEPVRMCADICVCCVFVCRKEGGVFVCYRKNAGTAVLYECVQTVLSIEAEPALRVLAVNILMRFLARNDNNTRYVALNLLSKVVTLDKPTVQRHKKIIVDCLNDPDISIRRRALELTYALVDATNCRHLVTEMVDYLGRADAEFKTDLTRKICIACEKYAPSKKWQLDTIIKVLSTAGSYVRDDIPSALVLLISQTPTLHLYAAQRLYAALYQATHARVAAVAGAAAPAVSGGKQEEQQPPEETLTQVAIWALGEYGDLLPTEPFELNPHAEGEPQVAVGPAELVGLLEQIIRLPLTTAPTRAYALTALTKLSGRFTDAPVLARITDLIAAYRTDITVELQQRACEYGAVLGASAGVLRQALVKRMPVPDLTCPLTRNTEEDENSFIEQFSEQFSE